MNPLCVSAAQEGVAGKRDAVELHARGGSTRRRTSVAGRVGRRFINAHLTAENAPLDLKDQVKARGYRWSAEAGDGARAWYIDVAEAAEIAFVQSKIYPGEVAPQLAASTPTIDF